MQKMKTIILSTIFIMAFSSNLAYAGGNIKKISKKNNIEISLKIKLDPYSLLKKMNKPNPVT